MWHGAKLLGGSRNLYFITGKSLCMLLCNSWMMEKCGKLACSAVHTQMRWFQDWSAFCSRRRSSCPAVHNAQPHLGLVDRPTQLINFHFDICWYWCSMSKNKEEDAAAVHCLAQCTKIKFLLLSHYTFTIIGTQCYL